MSKKERIPWDKMTEKQKIAALGGSASAVSRRTRKREEEAKRERENK